MSVPYTDPPALSPGARVALLAPAGPLASPADLERAERNVRDLGWEPQVYPNALASDGYLAGDDASRLADLNAAIRDPRIDGIWCLRGGYGTMRILDAVDYDSLRRRPKAVIGFSDITALHLAIRARSDVVSFHGPTARAELTPFSRESLARATGATSADHSARDPFANAAPLTWLQERRAVGRLEGGNLALVCALLGTPYTARFDGAILVLEDVNEPLYRIDRMLRQLILSGALERVAGLCFGAFTERGDEGEAGGRSLDVLFGEAAAHVRGPVVSNAPIGHVPDQWTLPLGAQAELAPARGLVLAVR
ncbi:MAG TPA: LD-carboxypeptidase [Gemmatimonadaceae bacterium]|nr:LD-carboxypeptidase [Gemmatimonadaceae bacterium]